MFGSFKNAFSLCVLVTLVSCSGTSGGSNDRGPAATVEKALARLSPVHRQKLETWKNQVVKSCNAAEAFGLGKSGEGRDQGVDAAALIQSNQGSVVFTEGENLAILGAHQSFSGVGTSKAEETVEVNGRGYMLSANTERSGSACALYLFGQKVYEGYIVQGFDIGPQWTPGKELPSLTSAKAPLLRKLGRAGAGELVERGIYGLLSQSLKPEQRGVALIARKLGLGADQASKLFKLSPSTYLDASVRVAGENSAVWSNSDYGNFIADLGYLQSQLDGAARTLPLEIRLKLPHVNFAGTKNTADQASFKLLAAVTLTAAEANFVYSISSVEMQGRVAFDELEANECAAVRATAYIGATRGASLLQPSVATVFDPCQTFSVDVIKAAYANGLLKALIPQVLADARPSRDLQYGGWDEILSTLALSALEQGQDIEQDIDPAGKTQIVGRVAGHLEILSAELARTKNLNEFRAAVLQMGLNWSFRGEEVSALRASQILQAVETAIPTFRASSLRLVSDLGRQPHAYDDQLNFASELNESYRREALRALAVARELNYSDFELTIFNRVLQERVSLLELQDWTAKLSTIRGQMEKYSNLAALRAELVGLSLEWLRQGQATPAELDAVYAAIDNAVVPFAQSTRELLRELKRLGPNEAMLDFARALSPEYKKLAISIRDNSAAANYASWGENIFSTVLQKRPPIEQLRAWSQLWSAALGFAQREKARIQGEFASSNERYMGEIMEIALKEAWSADEFSGLETIAEVARAKSFCDRHKGMSSLADCAGLALFSKNKGKFFDPAFAGRYVSLGSDFAGYMSQLQGFDWTSVKNILISEFFSGSDPIWSNCDQATFEKKASTLKAQVKALLKEKDQLKKWVLERQLRDTVRNCP